MARRDPLRKALEEALSENPDEVAGYMAYGDYLAELGDPRGEFIQVQLALEDTTLPAESRKKLKARERSLLKKHERDWLGPLGPFLVDHDTSDLDQDYYAKHQKVRHAWRRGFLASVEVHFLTGRIAHALADSPAARLLRELRVADDLAHWDEGEVNPPPPRRPLPAGAKTRLNLFDLIRSPCLGNLRVLQVGDETGLEGSYTDCHSYAPGLEHVIRKLLRIEELHLMCKSYKPSEVFGLKNLSHLRHLHVEHLRDYPVEVLAKNEALSNLERIYFHPHYAVYDYSYLSATSLRTLAESPHLKKLNQLFWHCSDAGDWGVEVLIESGLLDRLKVLSLRSGCVTDEGARLLAEHPATRKLEMLDLRRNQLTESGIAALRRTRVKLRCDNQLPVGSDEYLHDGDFE
jgi:uncharacterized protein (TIGR02996 family)